MDALFFDEAEARLKALGFKSDLDYSGFLRGCVRRAYRKILSAANIKQIPPDDEWVVVDLALSLFLKEGNALLGFNLGLGSSDESGSGAVKAVTEGGVALEFDTSGATTTTAKEAYQALLDTLTEATDRWIAEHRKIRW